jgi:AcrR family transcriptional regulator
MPRRTPPDRIRAALEAATRIFIAQGYRRTQMEDVASALGISKATLYLSFESKEALFDAALRHADGDAPPAPSGAPLATPPSGATLAQVRRRLASEGALPLLAAALTRTRVTDVRAELRGVLGELYDAMARNRTGIKLLDSCALDYPELAKLWYDGGRERSLALLSRYLDDRTRRGRFRRLEDVEAAARLVLETLTFWAVHRHWDPSPQPYREESARRTVLDLLTSALVKE